MSQASVRGSGAPGPGSRRRLAILAAVVVLLLAAAAAFALLRPKVHSGGGAPLPAAAASAVPSTLTFTPSGIDGGGFQNVIAIDPYDPRVVLAGADVAGVARSTDGGRSWRRANAGLTAPAAQRVAGILFNPRHRGEVYLAAGRAGVGGVWVSLDDGVTWTRRSAKPTFEGGRPPEKVQSENHPRFTGALLAADPRDGTLYAGTFDAGVMRSTDDGRTWTPLGLAGRHIRGLALDPGNPDRLYVGTSGAGVFATSQARGAASFTALPGSPADAEELRVSGGTVYVAGGTAGVFAGTSNGRSWARLGGGTVPSGPVWVSIAVSGSGASTVVYVGSYLPGDTGASVLRSADRGRTFTRFLGQSGLHNAVGGSGGPQWWLMNAKRNNLPGKTSYIAADIALDPRDPARVLVAGRAGVWGTTDRGRSWYPLVRGLDVTITNAVVADPNVPGRVYVALSDWTLVSSADGLRSVALTVPKGAPSIGWSLAVDPSTKPSTVLVGAAGPQNRGGGEVYESADPLRGSWQGLGLASATGGHPPLGLAVGFDGGRRVVLAAVEGSGLWRRVGSAGWARVQTGFGSAAGTIPLAWPVGDADAYAFDDAQGLLRSKDAGRTWQLAWRQAGAAGGFAVDRTHPDRGYAVVANRLYALTGLTGAAGTVSARPVISVPTAGAVAVDAAGSVFVTSAPGDATPRLFRSAAGGEAFTAVSAPEFASSAVQPSGLVTTAEGRLVVTLRGTGALVGAGR